MDWMQMFLFLILRHHLLLPKGERGEAVAEPRKEAFFLPLPLLAGGNYSY